MVGMIFGPVSKLVVWSHPIFRTTPGRQAAPLSIKFSDSFSVNWLLVYERYSGSRRRLCTVHSSAEDEHASVSLPVAKARSARKAAKQQPPSGIAALPPKRQCQAESQATVLAFIEAGRPPSKSGCSHPDALQFEPCDIGIPCCLAKDSSPALHEPRTTQASVAFVSRSKPARAVSQKAMCLLANLSTLPKYLQSWQ